jgi:hypothetical protein
MGREEIAPATPKALNEFADKSFQTLLGIATDPQRVRLIPPTKPMPECNHVGAKQGPFRSPKG